ncbi:MAG: adventurous gliding motility protein GltG [Myxococcales bacterium]|jgi:pSer/pThr/pTyr-binding forkhead associated (FHA) protein|nr:adventurous gliding motility protein GltG [Myxococcales bacterium]
MAIPLRLQIHKGDALLQTREFDREIIKIGRLQSAHLFIDDEKVSRIHAVLNVESAEQISIVDMGSIEGTFLNGKRVNKGQVHFGDEIRVGSTRIIVEDGSVAQAVTQAPAVAASDAAAPIDTTADMTAAPEPDASMSMPPIPGADIGDMPPIPQQAFDQMPPTPAQQALAVADAAQAASIEAPGAEEDELFQTRRLGRFAPKAFDSYIPMQPQPRRPAANRKGRLGLHIRYYWGDALLQSSQFASPRPVYVGNSWRCDFKLSQPDEHQLVGPGNGSGFTIQLGPQMAGALYRQDSNLPVQLTPNATCDLRETDFAWVDLGGIRAEFSFEEQPRPIVVPFFQSLDYRFLILLVLLGFMVGLFMVAASTHTEADIIADDIGEKQLKIVRAILQEAEKPQKNPLLDKLNKKEEEQPQPGEQAEKHKNDEGKMGKKDMAENKTKRSAPKAIDINAKDLVKHSGGLVSVLGGGGGGGLATIFGQGGLGGDIKGAIGNMHGPQVGDAGGFGGLGTRGTGVGGGGAGNTIGIGGIGTKGRGGGLAGYGKGLGNLGGKKSTGVEISDDGSSIQGSLDKELIRQVIQRNMGQIRYCYEKELQKKPDLAGKLVIRFEIAPKGNVTDAKTATGTTLRDAALSDCVTVRIRNWRFPEPKGGGKVIVTYPFVFKSSGD